MTRRALIGLLILAAAGLVGAQAPAPPIPKGTNVLFGRVLEMGTDRPIAGAIVTLVAYFDASGRRDERMPQIGYFVPTFAPQSAMTTGEGYFFFRDLPAGRYSLSADAFGYLSDIYPPHFIELAGRDAPTEVPLRLWKTGAISGLVIDDRGEPVVGVPVTAFQCETTSNGLVLRDSGGTVETDDRGMYRIAQLSPGRYVVAVLSSSLSLPATLAAAVDASASNRDDSWALTTALLDGGAREVMLNGDSQRIGAFALKRPGPQPLFSPDGRMLTYATTLYPGAASPAEATVITLGSGEARTAIDVPVRFAPTTEVSGVAVGPDGPMNGLTLELLPPSGATTSISRFEPQGNLMVSTIEPIGLPRAITDASGAFRFLAVSPGSYVLRAEYVLPAAQNPAAENISLWASQPLTVDEQGLAGLTIALRPGIRVSGRAEFKGAAESPLTGNRRLPLGLRPVGAGFWRVPPSVGGPDGTFTTLADGPGRYIVFTQDPPGWTLESVSRGGKTAPDDVIDLDSSEVTGLVLTFSQTPTGISGSISGANGASDANTNVIVFPADTTLWREGIFNNRRVRMTPATSAATFEFSGLAPGDYFIAAISARSVTVWADPSFLDRLIPGATRITLGAGEEKTVSLKAMMLSDW